MPAYQQFNSFPAAVANGVHNLGSDQLRFAFCAAGNAPVVGNSQLSQLTTIDLTNIVDTGLTVVSSAQSGGQYKLVLADKDVEADGGSVGPIRYVVIYNDSATNKELICFFNLGIDVTIQDGQYITLDFNQDDGLVRLTFQS